MLQPRQLLLLLLALLLSHLVLLDAAPSTNNWAVLVCSSRFWFNYRHMANTLAMYRTVKRLGIPDSQIILMLADDVACNPRNPFAGTVYSNADRRYDLYGTSIEVDYKGEEVSVETFLRLLSGRVPESTPVNKRLLTDERSNIFIYMTGHGGDEFLKFQDSEEVSAFDLADALGAMWEKKRWVGFDEDRGGFSSMNPSTASHRYHEILFMVDTCQANTLYTKFYSPNIIATGSSAKGENSYSHHADNDIGVAVTDRYTHHVLNYLEGINKTSNATLQDLVSSPPPPPPPRRHLPRTAETDSTPPLPLPTKFDTFSFEKFESNAGIRTDLYPRPVDQVLLTDFFGGVAQVEISTEEEFDSSIELDDNVDDSTTSEKEVVPMPLIPLKRRLLSTSIASTGSEKVYKGETIRLYSIITVVLVLVGLQVLATIVGQASGVIEGVKTKVS
ncbi:BZ3500_MvSof-1268-A1-R1_Chr11-1g03153 [Microbotryum saponariae]|uniref:BZ3500_MvSof-1268-A1-R1_Chr11-1g03153 protein n=1 Tax=Microbotryum saponariae TaxID=289078 RepID=A0A2X0LWB7_9BASI|nr:BZ3500_MvSof-1268-A1-R1_Chr11-1g03153 [Microbotryum saponariae]